jgi:sigma54-dependent transcription regulator
MKTSLSAIQKQDLSTNRQEYTHMTTKRSLSPIQRKDLNKNRPEYEVRKKSNATGNAVHEQTKLLPPPSHGS